MSTGLATASAQTTESCNTAYVGLGNYVHPPAICFLKWTSTHVSFSVTIGSILRLKFIIDLFWVEGDEYVQEWQINFIR